MVSGPRSFPGGVTPVLSLVLSGWGVPQSCHWSYPWGIRNLGQGYPQQDRGYPPPQASDATPRAVRLLRSRSGTVLLHNSTSHHDDLNESCNVGNLSSSRSKSWSILDQGWRYGSVLLSSHCLSITTSTIHTCSWWEDKTSLCTA